MERMDPSPFPGGRALMGVPMCLMCRAVWHPPSHESGGLWGPLSPYAGCIGVWLPMAVPFPMERMDRSPLPTCRALMRVPRCLWGPLYGRGSWSAPFPKCWILTGPQRQAGMGSPIPTLGVLRRPPMAFPIRGQTRLFLIPAVEQQHPSC